MMDAAILILLIGWVTLATFGKEAEVLCCKYESVGFISSHERITMMNWLLQIDIVKNNKYYSLALQNGVVCCGVEEWLTRSIPDLGCKHLGAWLHDVLEKENKSERLQ